MSPCRPCLTSRIGSSNKASYLSAPASPANILSTFPPTAFQDDINFYDFVYSNVKLEKKVGIYYICQKTTSIVKKAVLY